METFPEAQATGRFPAIAAHLPDLAALCRRFQVRRLEIFGSAATAAFDPESSDLDFLVEFELLPPGPYANSFFGFKEALEQLFGRPVDLVVPAAICNPYFLESVERSKTLLYAA
jgi:uncharacterized protein